MAASVYWETTTEATARANLGFGAAICSAGGDPTERLRQYHGFGGGGRWTMPDSTTSTQRNAAQILIVDDHPLIREGLATRIAFQPDMQVCGEATCVADALLKVKEINPDLVVVDIQLTESHGIDLIKEIKSRFPAVKMLVVSAFDESLYAEIALRAGAQGYINKRELQDNIIDALRAVLEGRRYVSPKMTQRLLGQAIDGVDAAATDPIARLSDRELEVFQLIGQGKTTSAIARQLHLSVHTIDTHREKIRHKLGVSNGTELMQRAVQWVLENG